MASSRSLRDDARAIWQAGLDAVRSDRLVCDAIRSDSDAVTICGHRFPLATLGRVVVVGAGKAGAGMAAGVEQRLGGEPFASKLSGWVNVPADCIGPLRWIHLHAARPAGVNEPTAAGVEGANRILALAGGLGPADVCLVLLSGGGSALLPAPKPPISLADKQAVTRFLMNAGATIDQLNTVRKRLSLIKGGGLARRCRAGHLIALIISDVVGDPLATIASGPTYADTTTDAEALAVLESFADHPPGVPRRVRDFLRAAARAARPVPPFPAGVANHIIGRNATALSAAAAKARQMGYQVVSLGSENQGEANEEGRALARQCVAWRERSGRAGGPVCLLSGGEPVVQLVPTERPRKGGRNQQLVLAALDALKDDGMRQIAILSGGTDGEDGPTDAAGAWADADLLQETVRKGIVPRSYLEINDAYHFFQQCDGLLITGPTHTNVMDLRVALVGRLESGGMRRYGTP